MSYSFLTVRDTISAPTKPAALVFSNGDTVQILDGLDGDALRGMARVLNRAAEHADEYSIINEDVGHSASSFSLSYEFEWDNETKSWPSDNFDSRGREAIK